MKVALIDDDPVEETILSGLAEHIDIPVSFTAFTTLERFLSNPAARAFDMIFLDRRVPPHLDFSDTLPRLAETGITAPIVLLTARTLGRVEPPEGLSVMGPYEKLDVQDPDVLADLLSGRRPPGL